MASGYSCPSAHNRAHAGFTVCAFTVSQCSRWLCAGDAIRCRRITGWFLLGGAGWWLGGFDMAWLHQLGTQLAPAAWTIELLALVEYPNGIGSVKPELLHLGDGFWSKGVAAPELPASQGHHGLDLPPGLVDGLQQLLEVFFGLAGVGFSLRSSRNRLGFYQQTLAFLQQLAHSMLDLRVCQVGVTVRIAFGLMDLLLCKSDPVAQAGQLLQALAFLLASARWLQNAGLEGLHQLLVPTGVSIRCQLQLVVEVGWYFGFVDGKRAKELLCRGSSFFTVAWEVAVTVEHRARAVDLQRYRKRTGGQVLAAGGVVVESVPIRSP